MSLYNSSQNHALRRSHPNIILKGSRSIKLNGWLSEKEWWSKETVGWTIVEE